MSQKALRTLPPAERLLFALAILAVLLLPPIAFVILSRQAEPLTLTVYAAEPLREQLSPHARAFEAQHTSASICAS